MVCQNLINGIFWVALLNYLLGKLSHSLFGGKQECEHSDIINNPKSKQEKKEAKLFTEGVGGGC